MNSNVVNFLRNNRDLYTRDELKLRFEQDVADLLSGRRQGHMEKWEYWTPDHAGDPAGGAAFWEELVRMPGDYYLPRADMAMLASAVQNSAVDATLRSIETVVELGPGSPESIAGKTIPFLKHAHRYIAVDQAAHQAFQAAEQVLRATNIATEAMVADYYNPPIGRLGRKRTAFAMWGGSIGNIAGRAGSDSLPGLMNELSSLAGLCNAGDVIFIGIDTQNDAAKLTAAYNHPVLSRKFLSVLHAAHKFGFTSGHFTPHSWSHKSVWHPGSRQCAHYLIAGEDQDFAIGGERLRIKAGYSVITNNSYKFAPDTVREAAQAAGFSHVFITSERPMALLMATR